MSAETFTFRKRLVLWSLKYGLLLVLENLWCNHKYVKYFRQQQKRHTFEAYLLTFVT